MQAACRPFSLAWAKTGNSIAARIAIIAMTTSSSISVNALLARENDMAVVRFCMNFSSGGVAGDARGQRARRDGAAQEPRATT
jgi:hypothetical protein